jgi:hypothetical protein
MSTLEFEALQRGNPHAWDKVFDFLWPSQMLPDFLQPQTRQFSGAYAQNNDPNAQQQAGDDPPTRAAVI